MKIWFMAAALLLCAGNVGAQQLALKETFSQDGRLLIFIANIDQDAAMEYVTVSDSGIIIYDSKTRQEEYRPPLNLENGENIYTNDPSLLRLRNINLVQDFNGNGVKDLILTGADTEPYFKVVDTKTGEQLLKVAVQPQDREVEVKDIDGDNYYELIISGGFTTNIYATQARVAATSGVEENTSGGRPAVYPNFPNPVKNGTTLAWELAENSEVKVTLHDLEGRMVRNVFSGGGREGVNLCWWDGSDEHGTPVSNGAYRVRIESNGRFSDTVLQVVR